MRNSLNEYYRVVITSDHFGDEVEDWVTFDDFDDALEFFNNHQVGQKFYNYTIVDIMLESIHILL